MKYVILCVDSPPGLLFLMRPLLFVSLWRTGEKPRLFARFHSQSNEYHSYRNRRAGWDSTQKIAHFIHRLICGAANIQLLSWSERCGCRGMAGGHPWMPGHPRTAWRPRKKPHLIGDQKKALNIPPLYRYLNTLYLTGNRCDDVTSQHFPSLVAPHGLG